MSALPKIAARLSPLLGKLGSSHDGEVLSAARAIGRQIEKHGLTFNDLGGALAAEPVTRIVYRDREPEQSSDWLQMAEQCAEHVCRMSDKEAEFIVSMRRILRRAGTEPTEKQAAWLQGIFDRIREEEEAAA